MTLDELKWKNRPLLLFAPSADNPQYLRQQELLKSHQQGLKDRDMVVLEVIGQDKVYLNGTAQHNGQAAHLRERFKVPVQDFAVVLVGKDGTSKLQKQEPVEGKDIFRLIDQMPMRQQEMKKDGQ